MTAPQLAHENRRLAQHTAHKRQRWAMLIIAFLGVLLAKGGYPPIGKGLVWGALVAFAMQWVFFVISFLRVRPHPKQAVNDMYLAMIARWGVGLVGFLLAFAWLKLNGLGVMLGFVLMQLAIVVTLYKVR